MRQFSRDTDSERAVWLFPAAAGDPGLGNGRRTTGGGEDIVLSRGFFEQV
ncbi:MAG: hypothetical protein RLZZ97_1729, partial [Gemmatimonadota bacterium]